MRVGLLGSALVLACAGCGTARPVEAPEAVLVPTFPNPVPARRPPPCPSDRVWNGAWCADPVLENAAASHYARIDADIRANFALERGLYQAGLDAEEIVGSAEAPGAFDRDLLNAARYVQQLDEVANGYASPRWRATALARQASLYRDLWRILTLRMYHPSPAQLAELVPLAHAGTIKPEDVAKGDMHAPLWDAWNARKAAAATSVALRGVSLYAQANALVLAYGVDFPNGLDVRNDFRVLADALGEAATRQCVTHTRDPIDPTKTLEYAGGP